MGSPQPVFDGIYRKSSALPDSSWPAPAQQPQPTRPRLPLPSRRIQVAVLGTVIAVSSIAVLFRPGPSDVHADTPRATPEVSNTDHPPVAFATEETSTTTPPMVLEEPLPGSLAQPDTTTTQAVDGESELPTVRILNGSLIPGVAATTKTTLEALGYAVLSIGDAQFDYVQTTIYYLEGQKQHATELAEALGLAAPTMSENIIASPADILVVLGGIE